MNDLSSAKASFKDQSVIFGRQQNWIMCILYLATFGSFIGFSAAFPMLIKQSFPDVNPLKVAFLGPLVGALFRPFGGWLADKLGGAKVTLINYGVMALAVMAVMYFLKAGNFAGSFHELLGGADWQLNARKESAAVVGFTSAFAAYGGFFIPKMFGSGLGVNGTFTALIVFYVICMVLTWWYYSRKGAEFPS